MIVSSSEIKPGNTYYHVYGYAGNKTTNNHLSEMMVVGVNVPYPMISSPDSTYLSYCRPGDSHELYNALYDMGIDCKPYNMNRLFSTKQSAEEYILRLQQDMITYDEMQSMGRGEIIGLALSELLNGLSDEFDAFDDWDND
jgi:hypothetical protein